MSVFSGYQFSRLVRPVLIIVLLCLSGFSGPEEGEGIFPPYHLIEKKIRAEFDSRALFPWEQYYEILTKLKESKFRVLPLYEMAKESDPGKVVVGIRHDIDLNPFKALDMARIEHKFGFRATYFILGTAEYNGSFKGSTLVRSKGIGYLYRELSETGAEIGIHNDLLTIMILYHIDPFKFNKSELSYFRSLNIPIYGTASHGSEIAKKTVQNYQIFSDFAKSDSIAYEGRKYPVGKYSLEKYGYKYEAYFINFNIYLSDSRGKWNDPQGFSGVMKKLGESKPGDRIEMLIHPVWWGKSGS